jgi:hypothetical protein
LNTEHLFNHRTLEDLAAGQVQFHILVRGQNSSQVGPHLFDYRTPSLQASETVARGEPDLAIQKATKLPPKRPWVSSFSP